MEEVCSVILHQLTSNPVLFTVYEAAAPIAYRSETYQISLKQGFMFYLHEAARIKFKFPQYMMDELNQPLPFELHLRGLGPAVDPTVVKE